MKKINLNVGKMTEIANKAAESVTPLAKQIADKASVTFDEAKKYTEDKLIPVAINAKDKTVAKVEQTKDKVFNAVDVNGDGQVGIDDVIIMALQVPGVHVSRDEFLRTEFFKNHSPEQIDKIISSNPSKAGISLEEIDKIADEVIQFERVCVSGISTALGMPGGIAIAATIPTDIAQYYGYMLRAAQKLMYLYGFPQINIDSNKNNVIDTEIMNTLIICLGVMYGVSGARSALLGLAKGLAAGVEKQLLKQSLTKGAIYPIVKSIAKWFNVKMTKEVFAGFFKKSIPVIGSVIGGGLTYMSFKPCCDQLKDSLRKTALVNPNNIDEDDIIDLEIN